MSQKDRDPTDPICAALVADPIKSPAPSVTASATKCPIRFLDHHSPEEVAEYFESHKHEIPRSHELCVKRYRRSEEDIRKLDAKYGDLVSMIQGLGQKHQAMLPTKSELDATDGDQQSDERVASWAHGVGKSVDLTLIDQDPRLEDELRPSRFDRPLKEVRVGESPSRPWGISVPYNPHHKDQIALSPPPAPALSACPQQITTPATERATAHLADVASPEARPTKVEASPLLVQDTTPAAKTKCPFAAMQELRSNAGPDLKDRPKVLDQPIFIRENASPSVTQKEQVPRMVFTGPVFIGYPIDQAIAFLNQHQQ